MCIIAIKPQGKKMFTADEIMTMYGNNPDGAGFMYADNGKVIVEKGYMDAAELIMDLSERDLTDKTVVLHFRIGTSGYFNELNCHPFPIYGKNAISMKTDLAMAHNGILRAYEPPKKSDINDTQVFIRNVLRPLKKGFLKNKDVLFLIQELIGTNKLAFLDGNGDLTLIGDYIEDNGYIYSNTSYKPYKKAAKKPDLISLWDDVDETGFWADWDSRHTS